MPFCISCKEEGHTYIECPRLPLLSLLQETAGIEPLVGPSRAEMQKSLRAIETKEISLRRDSTPNQLSGSDDTMKQTPKRIPGHIELYASAIIPGHCIIVNEFDRPEDRLVAVITAVEEGMVTATYLSVEMPDQPTCGPVSLAMPINSFGLRVYCDEEENTYWCEHDPALEVAARYSDRSRRFWQQPRTSDTPRQAACDGVFVLTIESAIEETFR